MTTESPSPLADQLWRNALELLRQGKITQADIAKFTGFSRSYVSLVVSGKRKPHLTQGKPPITPAPSKQKYHEHTGYKPRPNDTQAKIQRIFDQCNPNNLTDPSTTGQSCWLWTGYITPKGKPRTTYNKRSMTPQRKLYLLQGRPLPPTHKTTNRCANSLCCNPAHIIAIPKRKLPKLNLRRGY